MFLVNITSLCMYFAPESDGSGISEVKTVLSGINIYRCFSVETFVANVYYASDLVINLDMWYIFNKFACIKRKLNLKLLNIKFYSLQ